MRKYKTEDEMEDLFRLMNEALGFNDGSMSTIQKNNWLERKTFEELLDAYGEMDRFETMFLELMEQKMEHTFDHSDLLSEQMIQWALEDGDCNCIELFLVRKLRDKAADPRYNVIKYTEFLEHQDEKGNSSRWLAPEIDRIIGRLVDIEDYWHIIPNSEILIQALRYSVKGSLIIQGHDTAVIMIPASNKQILA